jgi:hypothetical protein
VEQEDDEELAALPREVQPEITATRGTEGRVRGEEPGHLADEPRHVDVERDRREQRTDERGDEELAAGALEVRTHTAGRMPAVHHRRRATVHAHRRATHRPAAHRRHRAAHACRRAVSTGPTGAAHRGAHRRAAAATRTPHRLTHLRSGRRPGRRATHRSAHRRAAHRLTHRRSGRRATHRLSHLRSGRRTAHAGMTGLRRIAGCRRRRRISGRGHLRRRRSRRRRAHRRRRGRGRCTERGHACRRRRCTHRHHRTRRCLLSTLHGHQLQRGLATLKPLPGLEHELGEALSVEPRAVRAAHVAHANLAVLKQDLRVSTGGLWIVQDDVTGLATDRRHRRRDVSRLGWPIDVLDLENVVAAHSVLRGVRRESRNGKSGAQG